MALSPNNVSAFSAIICVQILAQRSLAIDATAAALSKLLLKRTTVDKIRVLHAADLPSRIGTRAISPRQQH